MSIYKELSLFSRSLWLTAGMFVLFLIAFAFYVRAEQQIERAYESRYQSYMLADVLRHSSDDLTRMVRSYVATGEAIYKKHYQEILDIRDGKAPRPARYEDIYWDLVLSDDRRPSPSVQPVALMDLMRKAGFTEAEFARLAQAKANSDALTKREIAAMALIERSSPVSQANQLKATRMLNDDAYHQAKADIMRPISEFYLMVDSRTQQAIHDAEHAATLVRVMLIGLGMLLVFALWSAYRALHATLGCSVDELQRRIARLGSGDLSAPIPVPGNMGNSVLAWLAETQTNLARIDAERHRAEETIRRLNLELEQRVVERTSQLEAAGREIEEFSYSMSHDMRTPLRALDGFSKILLEEHAAGLDDEGKRLLKVLRDNAQRMGRLVDDILRFLSLGRREIVCVPIDIAGLVSEVFAQLQAAFPDREMHLEVGELPPALGDRELIRMVLSNLLSNAVKFSSTGRVALIEVGCKVENSENCYYVKDYGVGFDMRYVNKLFKVFERVHPTGQYEGSGIGLAIVKRIVERHGGRVWAEGAVGKGATIYFSLPDKERKHG